MVVSRSSFIVIEVQKSSCKTSGDNTTPLGGSLPRRSQRPERKNSLSQRPCVRDQGSWISAVVNINSLKRDGLRQAELCPRHTMKMKVCGPYCNVETNERGLRLLEFAIFNNLVLTNTLGPHKPSRRWT